MKSGRGFSVWNNNNFSRAAAWKNEGDNVYSIAFMPKVPGEVGISLQVEGRNYWNCVVKYGIEPPTETDWKNLEEYYSLSLSVSPSARTASPKPADCESEPWRTHSLH